jgi:hypothetical protein
MLLLICCGMQGNYWRTLKKCISQLAVKKQCGSRARLYIQYKPEKFAVQFFALVGTKNAFSSSIFTIDLETIMVKMDIALFCRVFQDMRTSYNNFLQLSNLFDESLPLALCILQIAQQTNVEKIYQGKEYLFVIVSSPDIH